MSSKRNDMPDAHISLGSNYLHIWDSHPFYVTIRDCWPLWEDFHNVTFAVKPGYLAFALGKGKSSISDRGFWSDYLARLCDRARDDWLLREAVKRAVEHTDFSEEHRQYLIRLLSK